MVSKSPLRAVKDNESAPKKATKKSVAQAAKDGSLQELLEAMRDRIAEAVTRPDCPARELASLTKRLQDITHDLDALNARDEDDLSSRVRDLELALRDSSPDHPLLVGSAVGDDNYDASAI